MRINQGGDAVVGCANHPAPRFKRAHLGHLQVLQRTNGSPEPGVVADSQQNIALGSKAGHKIRIHHLITNERGNLIALGLQHGLIGRATGKVRHRQIEERNNAAQHVLKWNIFAKRHQLLLQIDAIPFTDGGDAIEVARFMAHFLADRHSGNQCRISIGGETAHHAQKPFGILLEYRDRCFWPDNQVCALGAECHVAVQRQLRVELCRVPLHALFDVALNRRNAQRVTRWAGPGMMLERHANTPGADQQHGTGKHKGFIFGLDQAWQVAQQGRGQCQGERNQPHASQRCEPGQRAIKLAVTRVEPWEAGEEPAAEGFLDHP